ncbi:Scr1 family TA system antitoxin-like transcriptional regulator [Amycolatopsis nalaikhensis]|uniref:Scr1 family TA system antitoxin-like transcriptional regulator n=1 Tax=Amycolatopsis nalaikhensis TaxID=715472 RepID=A0ABY8XDD6_9PSEU|nr:Scr1 family TA system antitoxin-like transcriptional regulator [Amycolatopsis sp. 2-2]WIV52893.1 Scr1 family TA system antitoxin-like transcriptional regulator [Amycolatopsis sp. 2-2]
MTIAIAHALRTLREDSGISLRRVAKKAGISAAKLSGLETGDRRHDVTILAFLLGTIGVTAETMNRLVNLAKCADKPDFFDPAGSYEHILRSGFERLSKEVFEWSPTLFPRGLRSSNYSRAIQETSLPHPDTATAALVPAPARIWTDKSEPLFTFLIGETATSTANWPMDVICEQIEELATVSKLIRISVALVPTSFCPPGLVEPFTLYKNHRDTAFAVAVKHGQGTAFLTNEESVKDYAKIADWLRSGIREEPWP